MARGLSNAQFAWYRDARGNPAAPVTPTPTGSATPTPASENGSDSAQGGGGDSTQDVTTTHEAANDGLTAFLKGFSTTLAETGADVADFTTHEASLADLCAVHGQEVDV